MKTVISLPLGDKYITEDTILLTVTGCLLSGGMSMRIATKAFSYSFNVFHMSHSSMDGGGGKVSD